MYLHELDRLVDVFLELLARLLVLLLQVAEVTLRSIIFEIPASINCP